MDSNHNYNYQPLDAHQVSMPPQISVGYNPYQYAPMHQSGYPGMPTGYMPPQPAIYLQSQEPVMGYPLNQAP